MITADFMTLYTFRWIQKPNPGALAWACTEKTENVRHSAADSYPIYKGNPTGKKLGAMINTTDKI